MLHLPYIMPCTQVSVEELSMKTESSNSHFHGKDLVRIEEEVNLQAYLLCKNINSFYHNLLKIHYIKNLKWNLFRGKKS